MKNTCISPASTNQKHAYLLMVHDNLDQLQILLSMIDDVRNDIFIHVDSKVRCNFAVLKNTVRYSKMYFTKQCSADWGSPRQIYAEMILLHKATSTTHYAYYHLLSGRDLPIKSQDDIHNFFKRNYGKEFISYLPSLSLEDEERIRLYHPVIGRRGRSQSLSSNARAVIHHILCRAQRFLRVNRLPKDMKIGKGSAFFSITDGLARDLVKHTGDIHRLCRMTMTADEVFLQTFVLNSKWIDYVYKIDFDPFSQKVQNMRLIDWNRGGPYVWRKEDMNEIENSPMLFARKFDLKIDADIIYKVYEMVKGHPFDDLLIDTH